MTGGMGVAPVCRRKRQGLVLVVKLGVGVAGLGLNVGVEPEVLLVVD